MIGTGSSVADVAELGEGNQASAALLPKEVMKGFPVVMHLAGDEVPVVEACACWSSESAVCLQSVSFTLTASAHERGGDWVGPGTQNGLYFSCRKHDKG